MCSAEWTAKVDVKGEDEMDNDETSLLVDTRYPDTPSDPASSTITFRLESSRDSKQDAEVFLSRAMLFPTVTCEIL